MDRSANAALERRKASEKAIAAPMRADVNTREVSTDANIDPMSSRSERRKAITHADIDADARGPKCIERCAGPRTPDQRRPLGHRAMDGQASSAEHERENVTRAWASEGQREPARRKAGTRAKTDAQHQEWTATARADTGVERASTWRSMKFEEGSGFGRGE